MSYEIEIEIEDPSSMQVDAADLRQAVAVTLAFAGWEEGAVTIVVSNDEYVRQLNQQYRQIDSPTDILSFATQDDPDLDELPADIQDELGDYLGDLIIAYPFTATQALRYGNPLPNELRLLVVHGTLHLLGYDHDTDERQHEMWQAQGSVLRSLGDTATNWEREYAE